MKDIEIVKELHKLADWIEKANSLQAPSIIRKAAWTISVLEEENKIFRMRLNKKDYTLSDRINMKIGSVVFFFYKIKKKWMS